MYVVAVANAKGGVGKSTVATHLAAHFARCGNKTGLADLDRQRCSTAWLKRRPTTLPTISQVPVKQGELKVPKKTERLVVDSSAALSGAAIKNVVQRADMIVVPVLASAFDEDGLLRFVKRLGKEKPIRKNKRALTFLANRVKLRTNATAHLEAFLADHNLPITARLRDTQFYPTAAREGLSIFEMSGSRIDAYVEEWSPLLKFISGQVEKGR